MGRKQKAIPTVVHHRPTGQARVRIGGKDIYLGRYGSREAKQRYAKLIAELKSAGPAVIHAAKAAAVDAGGISVAEMCEAWLDWAKRYYVKAGKPTSTLATFKTPIRVLRELYGFETAASFGTVELEAVRNQLVKEGVSRGVANTYTGHIRRIFRWAECRRLVPKGTSEYLRTLDSLQPGRTSAPETKKVDAVPDSNVNATLPHLPTIVQDMVKLQRASGMRPAEVCNLRPQDIDRTGKVWRYVVKEHKTYHKDCERIVLLGPQCQDILRKYLLRPADAFCFSPAEAVAALRTERQQARKTPLHIGNSAGTHRRRKPMRQPGDHYDHCSYRRAIHRACDNANIPAWSPNQLRHRFATEARKVGGIEAVQRLLSHADIATSQRYAEPQDELACGVAMAIG